MESKNKNFISRILAWIGLIVIALFIAIIIYALLTQNGMLAFAFTLGIIILSILIWIMSDVYKRITKKSKII